MRLTYELGVFGFMLVACGGTTTDPRDFADAAVNHDGGSDAQASDGGGGGAGGGHTDGGGAGADASGGGGGGGGGGACSPNAQCNGLTSCTDSCFGTECCYLSCNCWSNDDRLHCSMTCN